MFIKYIVVLSICFFSVSLYAQDAAKTKDEKTKKSETKKVLPGKKGSEEKIKKEAKVAKKPSKGKRKSPWWNESSQIQKYSDWKFHFESEFKYTYKSGTIESDLLEVTSLVAVRKDRFTNFLFLDFGWIDESQNFAIYSESSDGITQQKLSAGINAKKITAVDVFRYDISDRYFIDLGYEIFRDDLTYIYRRDTFFVGFGAHFNLHKNHSVTITSGFGSETNEFTSRSVLARRGVPKFVYIEDTPDSEAFYYNLKFSSKIRKNISIESNFFHGIYFKTERKSRWDANVKLISRLSEKLAFILVLEVTFNDNGVVNTLGGDSLNSEIVAGIKLSF
ncbi:MAG: hypothetical protein COA79_18060 [Planctomycetota bacterium]|nr:MAG: hypothetical protein COA79_18060 [Planctomycetota bacterium]